MAKNKNKTQKITKEQLLTMERAVRRNVDIENGITPFKSKVHKSAKQYNRKLAKQVNID